MRLIAIAALLFSVACAPAPAEQAAPARGPSDAAAAAGDAPTPQMLVGRWGDNGDCSKDITFNADGTFASYTGGTGTWSLDGDIMTMSGSGGAFQVRVSILNGNQLLIGNPDGSIGISQRC